ncbi:MAG: hypothetical protein ACXVWZ_10240 [Nocardioides sp.]
MTGRWWRRAGVGLAAFAVAEVLLSVLHFDPDAARLGLLVALGVTAAWLLRDALVDAGPDWEVPRSTTPVPRGADHRLASYVRLVEGHLTASSPDGALRDRLATLCDQRLGRRHGLHHTDPEARALLGPDLADDLQGPPRRLTRRRVEDHLRRIEEL